MADLVSVANGNLTTAATWGQTGHTLISTSTGSTALTTGNLDSASFVPAASAIIGMLVRLAARASGSPSNTMTVHLRNSTSGSNVKSVTVNVSDLPVATAGTDSEGGWLFLKFDSAHTPNGTDSYVIRATLSATSTAVSLATNGTANNWQHMLVLSSTAAPTTGDDMHILGAFDGANNPATFGTRSVTMDSTASTDYGSANTNRYVAAIDVSKGGTLVYGTTPSTTYVLRISGWVKVYSGGTWDQTAADSTIIVQLEIDDVSGSFGFNQMNLGTLLWQGTPRTPGKLVSWTRLTATSAAGATSSSVADDAGWLNGDEILFASTARNAPTQAEAVSLTAGAGASSLTHGALTNAHLGDTTTGMTCPVVLGTRNCIVRGVSTNPANGPCIRIQQTANVDADWTLFRYISAGSTNLGIEMLTTTGTVTFTHCLVRDTNSSAWSIGGTSSANTFNGGTITLQDCWGYNIPNRSFFEIDMPVASAGITLNRCGAIMRTSNGVGTYFFRTGGSTRGYNYIAMSSCIACSDGGGQAGFRFTSSLNFAAFSDLEAFTCASGLDGLGSPQDYIIENFFGWRNADAAMNFARTSASVRNARFLGTTKCYGNGDGLAIGDVRRVYFQDLRCFGDTTYAQSYGIEGELTTDSGQLVIDKITCGPASGILVNNATGDVVVTASGHVAHWLLNWADLNHATKKVAYEGSGDRSDGYIAYQLTTGQWKVIRPLMGTVERETTTVTSGNGIKMSPSFPAGTITSGPWRLESAANFRRRGFLVACSNGDTPTISADVQKDGSYTGAAPRLVVKAAPHLGIDSDTVLDTLSVGANTWETLSGTTAAVTADGLLEVVVDCDGLAGSVFVDNFVASGNTGVIDGSAEDVDDALPVLWSNAAGTPVGRIGSTFVL